jgi:hypothetical protein
VFRRANGTVASPSSLLKDDVILNFTCRGWQGSNGYTQGGQGSADIEGRAAENWANGAAGGYWAFRTTDPGTLTSIYRMRIGQGVSIDNISGGSPSPFVDPGPGNLGVLNGVIVGTFTKIAASSTPVTPAEQIHGTSASTASGSVTRWSADANAAQWYFLKSRGAAIGTRGALSSGDAIATQFFGGDDGTNFITAARITATVDGAPGTNIMPGRLGFFTSNAAGSATEGMRIDKGQNVIIGTAALLSTATDGFLLLTTCPGAPTGTPTAYAGRAQVVYDTTNNKFWAWNGSAWKGVALV